MSHLVRKLSLTQLSPKATSSTWQLDQEVDNEVDNEVDQEVDNEVDNLSQVNNCSDMCVTSYQTSVFLIALLTVTQPADNNIVFCLLMGSYECKAFIMR